MVKDEYRLGYCVIEWWSSMLHGWIVHTCAKCSDRKCDSHLQWARDSRRHVRRKGFENTGRPGSGPETGAWSEIFPSALSVVPAGQLHLEQDVRKSATSLTRERSAEIQEFFVSESSLASVVRASEKRLRFFSAVVHVTFLVYSFEICFFFFDSRLAWQCRAFSDRRYLLTQGWRLRM